jgi:long-chain-fatty-acid--CoA ligase ACSBG
LPGTQIKIFSVDENGVGEICMRGRNVFMGYLHNESETIEVFDNEGYFHSGDLGFIDENGILDITGRIKELIITAGGENISPVKIEINIKEQCPILSNVVLIGDNRKYLTCLVTLKA